MLIKKIAVIALSVALALGMVAVPAKADITASNLSRVAGRFVATQYSWHGLVVSGNTATGAVTITLGPSQVSLPDGRQMNPFGPASNLLTPISLDLGANNETVTPTAVSPTPCPTTGQFSAVAVCVNFTGTFNFTHGTNTVVASGSGGLQEAIWDAYFNNGGMVVVDSTWNGTNAMLVAAVPVENVSIEDDRTGGNQVWEAQGGTAIMAAPAVLTNSSAGFGVNGANFTGGAYTGSNTYITCITYVDIYGQESPCSATFTVATSGVATTDQIGYTAPAAATGAVGYKIYITLNGGSYVSAYNVPLVTQPTVQGVYPVSNGVCVLTKVETTTPACAVANTTYGQVGSGAVVSALTLNTSQIEPELTIASSTTIYVPNPGARTVYTYAPGSHIGYPGVPSAMPPFTITTAAATTVPNVLGTINIPPGFMNYIGRTIEVCGYSTMSSSTDTIEAIQFQWDANGQNTAGKGVVIGYTNMTATGILNISFCEDFQTSVQGVTATAGSINSPGGYIAGSAAALGVSGAGANTLVGTVGSLNLADAARINVIYLHTTGTDGSGMTLQGLTVKVVN